MSAVDAVLFVAGYCPEEAKKMTRNDPNQPNKPAEKPGDPRTPHEFSRRHDRAGRNIAGEPAQTQELLISGAIYILTPRVARTLPTSG